VRVPQQDLEQFGGRVAGAAEDGDSRHWSLVIGHWSLVIGH
jgi:hypothetical protein